MSWRDRTGDGAGGPAESDLPLVDLDPALDATLVRIADLIENDPASASDEAERLAAHAPNDPRPYLIGGLAALCAGDPARCLRFVRRLRRRFVEHFSDVALEALALLQQRKTLLAQRVMRRLGPHTPRTFQTLLPVDSPRVRRVVREAFASIERGAGQSGRRAAPRSRGQPAPPAKAAPAPRASSAAKRPPPASPDAEAPSSRAASTAVEGRAEPPAGALAAGSPELRVVLRVPDRSALLEMLAEPEEKDAAAWFRLRHELAELSLVEGFDELLCLPTLQGVERYWHQVETARRVLKHFKGRVLLADEVGLGKTVEAGMVLKEYVLRGMAERVLVIVPPSLVGQWQEELATKFGLEFVTTNDPELRSDPERFWRRPRVIASLPVARREEQRARLAAAPPLDVVIVDEAHRLKDRSTRSYRLVHELRTRFLLLLSATPVQNDLIELYNLLTLLQPGIFRTEREFRSAYVTKGSPRTARNRDALRALMRDVMIRNTRALVDVRLPPRQVLTQRVEPSAEEAACYADLCDLVAAVHGRDGARAAFGLRHLLHAAGSSPRAAASALAARAEEDEAFAALASRYRALGAGAKERALALLLEKNPHEKKLVFVAHRASQAHLASVLEARGIAHARFHGGLSATEKDAAVAAFRESVPVLLCTESGGEGRNLQFCNTVIHFDLPWNPMAIEQRIGRVHRIGQTREVFVFNLATRHTVEDALLAILDEKLNLFELVVGEVDAILGELDQDVDFAELVYRAWVEATPGDRARALEPLGEELQRARGVYESARALDEELFADDLEVAG
jgi:superfamily II DNA or RNA helicase